VGIFKNVNNKFKTHTFKSTYGYSDEIETSIKLPKEIMMGLPVFIADMITINEVDTAGLRYKNLTNDSVKIKVEEETTDDKETKHKAENVGYITIYRPTIEIQTSDLYVSIDRVQDTIGEGTQTVISKITLDATDSMKAVEVRSLNLALYANHLDMGVDDSIYNFSLYQIAQPILATTQYSTPGQGYIKISLDFSDKPLIIEPGTSKIIFLNAKVGDNIVDEDNAEYAGFSIYLSSAIGNNTVSALDSDGMPLSNLVIGFDGIQDKFINVSSDSE